MTDTTEQKKPKSQGPIRTGAVVPFLIIVALFALYFIVFFDGNVRRAIEFAATYVNGAEVDVGSVHTSFLGGSFTLNDMQVTSVEEPAKNKVQIGRMHFQFLWDALLRAKVVISDASIDGFQINTERKYPGKVTRKPDPKIEEKKDEAKGSALSDAANLLKGSLDLKSLKDTSNLKSQAKLNEIQNDLKNKEKEWNTAMQSMPTGQELNTLKDKISKVKLGGTNNPIEIAKQLQDVSSLANEANDKINKVKNTGQTLQTSVSSFGSSLKDLDGAVQSDIKDLEGRLKLPKLDVESLSKQFFGDAFLAKIEMAKRYMLIAKKYMPAKKAEDEKTKDQLEPPTRSIGKNYHFPITTGYPLFWLKHASLSSKAEGSPFGGDIKGQIMDVCSKPSQIGRPTLIEVAGNFPGQGISDLKAKVTIDHTGDVGIEKLDASIGAMAIAEKMLSQSDSLKFGMGKAISSSTLTASVEGDKVLVNSKSKFHDIDYVVKADSQQLGELLKGAVKDIPVVNVDAEAKGTISDLQWNISSNIAADIQKSFEKQLKAKLDEAKGQIQKIVDEKIGAQKKQLTDQYASLQNKYTSELKDKTKEVEKMKSDADAKMNQAKNQGTGDTGNKAVDDLKKKLHF